MAEKNVLVRHELLTASLLPRLIFYRYLQRVSSVRFEKE
jgi:hypothetical protein